MISSFPARRVAMVVLAWTLLFAPACTTPPQPATTASSLQTLDYAGDQTALLALDQEIAAAGTDRGRLLSIGEKLMTLFSAPSTTPAARQAIGQRLGLLPASLVAKEANAAMFVSMLTNEKQVDDARLALDRLRSPEADSLYLRALASATGLPRLAIIQSIGNRRSEVAVASLGALLKSADAVTAAAAAKSLGQIGTPAALVALASAPDASSLNVLQARLAAAAQVRAAQATPVYQSIHSDARAPAHLRAAAYRGLLFAEPARASARFVSALSGSDNILKIVVLESIATHPSNDLSSALISQLEQFDLTTQQAVIAALVSRNEVAVLPKLASFAVHHADPGVRSAAIVGLGRLPGNAENARLLAGVAAGGGVEEAKLARQSLSRLNGPGVDDVVIDGAKQGDQALRVIYLEQIAARNMAGAVPLLLTTRSDPAPAVRAAALSSLAEIAPATEQRAILDWTIAATHPTEQARALRALASVTMRDADALHRADAIIAEVDRSDPTLALRLLPVLPRVGGAASAESAGRLALNPDAKLSSAAINTLSRWPDAHGLPALVNVAEKASVNATRATAIEAILRSLERNRDLPASTLVGTIDRVVPLSQDAAIQDRLIYLLARTSSNEALALAQKFQTNPALSRVANDATMAIRSNLTGKPTLRASGNERQIGNMTDGRLRSSWSVPARADQWVEIDFKLARPFRQIVLDNNAEISGSPVAYAVFVTDDPAQPGTSRVTGAGKSGKTIIDLPAETRGRYVIIRHTADGGDEPWVINELVVD